MAWYDENRMAVEGQRYQEELYSRHEEKEDHIVMVLPDGIEVYEDGYDDIVTYCDVVDCCEDCPRYGDDCDGEEEDYDD